MKFAPNGDKQNTIVCADRSLPLAGFVVTREKIGKCPHLKNLNSNDLLMLTLNNSMKIHVIYLTNNEELTLVSPPIADINKGSPIDFKSGSACSTPTKDTLKGYERSTQGCMGPVLPPRSVMNGMPAHHYSAPMNFRKDLAARCSSPWVSVGAISALVLCVLMLILLTTFGGLHWTQSAPCTVLVGNEAAEVTAAKSTNTDLSKLHNSARAKNGQGIGMAQGQPGIGAGGAGGGGAAGGSSAATVTTATSNSGTAQGLQSTSASAEATSSAATSSSQSSLTPSTSLSSSLANANNGGNYAQLLIIFK